MSVGGRGGRERQRGGSKGESCVATKLHCQVQNVMGERLSCSKSCRPGNKRHFIYGIACSMLYPLPPPSLSSFSRHSCSPNLNCFWLSLDGFLIAAAHRFKGSYLFLDCQPMPAKMESKKKKINVAKRSRTVQKRKQCKGNSWLSFLPMPSNAICGWPKSQILEMKTWIRICFCNLLYTLSLAVSLSHFSLSLSLSLSPSPSSWLSLQLPLSICYFARGVQIWKPVYESAFGFALTLSPSLLPPFLSPRHTLQTSQQMSKIKLKNCWHNLFSLLWTQIMHVLPLFRILCPFILTTYSYSSESQLKV